jgi:hypothetical protein
MSTHCRIHADQERYASKMEITIEPYGWGEARPHDVGALLFDVASQLNRLVREPFAGPIRVVPAPRHHFTPMIHYRISRQDPITIQLAARDRSWSQFAYQFAHEFCHSLSNYELLRDNPNRWFHEALCELASVFTLRRMTEHGQLYLHIRTGQITRARSQATPTICYRIRNVNYHPVCL